MVQQRRRRQRKQPRGFINTAEKALAVARAVRALINVEYKNIRVNFTADPNSTGAVVNLTGIAQGDTNASRDGNKVRAKHLHVGGSAVLNASATTTLLRMYILRDNNGSTTQPAITDLWSSVNVFFNGQPKLGDPQNNSRFSVLWDKKIILSATGGKEQAYFEYKMELDHHIFYTGTASTDEGKGNVYLFIASSEATNDPVISAACNIKFLDN